MTRGSGSLRGTAEKVLDELVGTDDGDATAAAMVASLNHMCLQMSDAGWDLPSMLFLIERTLPPRNLADELAAEDDMQAMMLSFTHLEAPFHGLDGYGVAQLLHELARRLRHDDRTVARVLQGRDAVGWVLANEAWMLRDTPARDYKALDPATRGRISDRPDRVECRNLVAVDRAGFRYLVSQVRDETPMILLQRDTDGQNRLTGNIPDAIADLADALPMWEAGQT